MYAHNPKSVNKTHGKSNKVNHQARCSSTRIGYETNRESRLEESLMSILSNLKLKNIKSTCNRDIIVFAGEDYCEVQARERILPESCDENVLPPYDYIMVREFQDTDEKELIINKAFFKEGVIKVEGNCIYTGDYRCQIVPRLSFESKYTSDFKRIEILGSTELSGWSEPHLLSNSKPLRSRHREELEDNSFQTVPKVFQKLRGSTQSFLLGAYLAMHDFLSGVETVENKCLITYFEETRNISCKFISVTNYEFLERNSRKESSSTSPIILLEIHTSKKRKTFALLDSEFVLECETGQPIGDTFDFWTLDLDRERNSYSIENCQNRFFDWGKCDFNCNKPDKESFHESRNSKTLSDKCKNNLTETFEEILDEKLLTTAFTKTVIRLRFERGVIVLSTGVTINSQKQNSDQPLFFLQFGKTDALLPIFQRNLGGHFKTIEESRPRSTCRSSTLQKNKQISLKSTLLVEVREQFMKYQRPTGIEHIRRNWARYLHRCWNKKAEQIEKYDHYNSYVSKSKQLERFAKSVSK